MATSPSGELNYGTDPINLESLTTALTCDWLMFMYGHLGWVLFEVADGRTDFTKCIFPRGNSLVTWVFLTHINRLLGITGLACLDYD